ncbi:hypothetical protein KUV57_11985 [Epibacterium sp. DP7N7-1]|nr:hypothetical protein [Epibacterium sp. DP7N7-1]
MIFSLFRFLFLGLVVMSITYLMTRYYIGSTLREKFEIEWEELPHFERGNSRDEWVNQRMAINRNAIRARAFVISFVVPVVSVIVIILAVNFL